MEQLVHEGKVIYVGSSNFAGWNIVQANEKAGSRHFLGLVSEQSLYNLTARTVELEVLPVCQEYGLGVIPWSPLGGGLLGGALRKSQEGRRASSSMQEAVKKNRAKLEAYEALCAQLGEEPAQVALAWLLSNPAVTAPIIGPRTTEQLDRTLHALEIPISKEILEKLDEILDLSLTDDTLAWEFDGRTWSRVAMTRGVNAQTTLAEGAARRNRGVAWRARCRARGRGEDGAVRRPIAYGLADGGEGRRAGRHGSARWSSSNHAAARAELARATTAATSERERFRMCYRRPMIKRAPTNPNTTAATRLVSLGFSSFPARLPMNTAMAATAHRAAADPTRTVNGAR